MASEHKKKKIKLDFGSRKPQISAIAAARTRTSGFELPGTAIENSNESLELKETLETEHISISRAASPEILLQALEQPLVELSRLERDNVKVIKDGKVTVELAPGERLVLLGEGEVSVERGQITIMGATLQTKDRHKFCSPSSHSLPVMRCLGTEASPAKIILYQSTTGLANLSLLSPLFGKMWNDDCGPLSEKQGYKQSTFQILFSSKDGPLKTFLQPIISAPEWNQVLAGFSRQKGRKTPAIMICGPKSSGKSTFAKILANKLLSDEGNQTSTGVALLDLDPGQPEYSIPGQLSLVHLREPNLGPPFSHPWPVSKDRLIRTHTIAAITPAEDPELYKKCALDLFAYYRILLAHSPNCCLVINTPGWVLGTGLEILADLITQIRPTDIVYMSQEGPLESVNRLKEAAKTTPVHTLPSQVCEYTTRTAAHLRTMQAMSYFHSNNDGTWNSEPLTHMPPWVVRYAGENAGIFGILPYGEWPSPEHLLDSINGSIVAVVVLDSLEAIPGKRDVEKGTEDYIKSLSRDQITNDVEEDDDNADIIMIRDSMLPYFNPLKPFTLDPQHSHCIGQALVRGIDVPRRQLQLLTPIDRELIAEYEGKPIVLVSGKFDTPGWAYTEDMSGTQSVPWVEALAGSEGRGIGSRVWRVRRDLGRDGGD